jgi:enoyl-CoA hydratase/carnithine racemase
MANAVILRKNIEGIEILTFEEACTLEANLLATLFATEDQKEDAHAFLEKRAPKFKNR